MDGAVRDPGRVSTDGSSVDTLLAVYTGTSVGSLSTVAFNDEDGAVGVDTSAVAFDAVGGTTYWIAVDGFGAATGLINLSLSGVALLRPASPRSLRRSPPPAKTRSSRLPSRAPRRSRSNGARTALLCPVPSPPHSPLSMSSQPKQAPTR
jgi:hypothetical protein